MDIEKTKSYYNQIRSEDLCDCDYCRNNIHEVKAEKMAKKYDCAFVDNEMPYGRVPQGHPVIVDYFYHEEIRGTENTGKRNR